VLKNFGNKVHLTDSQLNENKEILMKNNEAVVNISKKLTMAIMLGLCVNLNVMGAEAEVVGEPSAEYISPTAGVHPDQRPAGAPVITEVKKDKDWYKQAETGLQPPFSPSLSFLLYQGNWFNPFIHPGMLGKYDIRGWHNHFPQAVWR
jgi:hypothetical protein